MKNTIKTINLVKELAKYNLSIIKENDILHSIQKEGYNKENMSEVEINNIISNINDKKNSLYGENYESNKYIIDKFKEIQITLYLIREDNYPNITYIELDDAQYR